jgi:hypothetical protein
MDNYYKIQTLIFLEYLKENIATASMVYDATGISQKNICRYKLDLQENNRLWEVEQKKCKITGCLVWYLTCNPDLVPPSNQLEFFTND